MNTSLIRDEIRRSASEFNRHHLAMAGLFVVVSVPFWLLALGATMMLMTFLDSWVLDGGLGNSNYWFAVGVTLLLLVVYSATLIVGGDEESVLDFEEIGSSDGPSSSMSLMSVLLWRRRGWWLEHRSIVVRVPAAFVWFAIGILFGGPRLLASAVRSLRERVRPTPKWLAIATKVVETLLRRARWVPVTADAPTSEPFSTLVRIRAVWLRDRGGRVEARVAPRLSDALGNVDAE